jgi:tRNA(Ile)-lysidine synthetase-like protein
MLSKTVRQYFVKHCIEPCAVLAAVSGGADSTALLVALAELRDDGFTLLAAHVNHHLRGEDSDADEAFVRALCEQFNVPLHVADGTLDDDRVRVCGVEAAAREIRYARLRDIRDGVVANFIVTAHQKNDQAETVLMRLLTGSGIAGLRGIHPVRGDGVLRPLLEVTREEIDAFLRERGIAPRHDRSNDDPRFLRNRVRVVVRELDAVENLAAIAAQARRQWPVLERAIDEAETTCARVERDETRFVGWPDDPWLRQALLHRHIHRLDDTARDVSARDLERLASEAESLKRVSVTKELELIRRGGEVVLRRVPRATPDFEVELQPGTPTRIDALAMTMGVIPNRELRDGDITDPNHVPSPGAPRHPLPALRGEGHSEVLGERPDPRVRGEGIAERGERHSEVLGESPSPRLRGEGVRRTDEGRVPAPRGEGHSEMLGESPDPSPTFGKTQRFQLPLNVPGNFTVRNRRNGDRFHPLGAPAAKKLKDFLIDRKIAAELRDRIPLLLWNGEIVWVAGVEVSERFKVSGSGGEQYEVWLEDSRA